MRFLIFATIFFTVMLILTLLISRRFINKLHFNRKTRFYINLFLGINLLGVLGYMLARYNPTIPNWAYFMLSIPIGVIFLLFFATVVYEISNRVLKAAPLNEKRRDFFKKSLDITAISMATAVNAKAMYNAKNIQIEEIDIKIDNLKKPYKIVQLSDIHIGGLIDKNFISDLTITVNSYHPDIIVITGDLVDTNIEYAKEALNELKNMKSTYGNYFIVGNHEYFHNIGSIIKYVNTLGFKTLENENIYIGKEDEGFNLAGIYDIFGYRVNAFIPDLKKALDGRMINNPTVLLAHQPKFIEEVEDVDLVLSGHTHGGQIFPFNYLVQLQQPYVKGLHKHNDKTQIYVNKGTGFWGPPMRLGASSEITVINLS